MKFKTIKEFNKCYDNVRNDILERHGYKKGDRVKLKKAMTLMISFDGENFINTGCYSIIDMKDKIKMYELSSNECVFKLQPLV